MTTLRFRLTALALCGLLSACAAPVDKVETPKDLGDFRLGHNIVIADNAEKVPPSRDATDDEWEMALTKALDARFRRYDGEALYHFGISVDAYALAVPGIPVLVSPKSVVVVSVNVWDNATQTKLTAEPKQLTIFEGLNGETVVGSGLTRSREVQMEVLSANAARAIERYLDQNADDWFGAAPRPDRAPTVTDEE